MKIIRVLAAAAAIAAPSAASAQVTITPAAGAFIPASDLASLREGADRARIERAGTLGLGLNLELGWLRGSVAYATGATLSESGVDGRENIGDGSLLAAAVDVVLRPLPRVLVQPYVLGGAGLKREDYSFRDAAIENPLPADRSEFALHVGAGADLMLGGFGVMVEITDFISRKPDGGFGQHDAFAMLGVRIRTGF